MGLLGQVRKPKGCRVQRQLPVSQELLHPTVEGHLCRSRTLSELLFLPLSSGEEHPCPSSPIRPSW